MKAVPPSSCPKCGDVHDLATAADLSGEMPEPGDFSICFNCGAINQFDEDLQVQPVDQETMDMLDEETRNLILTTSRSVERMKHFNLPMPEEDEEEDH